MNKTYPFTTDGVANWQHDLYALSDQAVWEESALAAADFAYWLVIRFALDEAQQTFLNGIPARQLQHWGASVSYFIRSRLPITLTKPEPPATGVRSAKLVIGEELDSTSDGTRTLGSDTQSRLHFRIQYG